MKKKCKVRKRRRIIAIKAADNAPTQKQLKLLLEKCKYTKDPLVFKMIVIGTGIIGLREGELAHLRRQWIDFEYGIIKIPTHEPCDCYKCRNSYREKLMRQNIIKDNISNEEIRKHYWQPKYQHGRSISFRIGPDIELFLKKFFTEYDIFPVSQKLIYDYVKKLGAMTGIEPIYPHACRASAAMQFARDGYNTFQLMGMMGWTDLETARHYVRLSGQDVIEKTENTYSKNYRFHNTNHVVRKYHLTPIGKKLLKRKRRENEEEWIEKELWKRKHNSI